MVGCRSDRSDLRFSWTRPTLGTGQLGRRRKRAAPVVRTRLRFDELERSRARHGNQHTDLVASLLVAVGNRLARRGTGDGAATRRPRQRPRAGELSLVIRSAIVESVSHEPRVRRVAPDWLRLISSEPELAATAPLAYRPWIETLARYIASRLPDAPAAICRALATAYQAAAFAALIEWADAGAQGDCADAVEEMLRWMDIHAPVTIPHDRLAPQKSQPTQGVSP